MQVKRVSKRLREKAVQNALLCNYNMLADAPVTLPACVGKHVEGMPKQPFTKEELVGRFHLVPFNWDGRFVGPPSPQFVDEGSRTSQLLLDREHWIVGILAGQPHWKDDWQAIHDSALAALLSRFGYSGPLFSYLILPFPSYLVSQPPCLLTSSYAFPYLL